MAPASMSRRRIRRAATRRRISLLPRLGQGLTMSRRNCYEANWPICRPFYRGSRIASGRSMPKGSSILRKSSVARKSSMQKIILQDVSSVCPPGRSSQQLFNLFNAYFPTKIFLKNLEVRWIFFFFLHVSKIHWFLDSTTKFSHNSYKDPGGYVG